MRKLFLLLFICVYTLSLEAERVNIKIAQQIAENVISGNAMLRESGQNKLSLAYTAYSKGASSVTRSIPGGDNADYYVFNINSTAGFVIIAGEDRVRPILGYSTEGHFDITQIPYNMKVLLQHYQKEINYVAENNITPDISIKTEWAGLLKNTVNITPKVLLRTATWGQDDPYNRKSPLINNQRAKTGCVATAQGIVMQYHQHPKQAQGGVASYMNIPITYEEYDWDNILPEYKEPQPGFPPYYTQYQADLMATLIWQCGANMNMNYGLEESSTCLSNSITSMQDVFGYSKQMRYITKKAPSGEDAYSWMDWMQILREELDNKRVVLYEGETEEKIDPLHGTGHAFVCDGYTEGQDLFHINWGWGGYLNGYFLLTTLDPKGDNKGYSERPGMVINIKPDNKSDNKSDIYQLQSVECAYLPFKIGQPVIVNFKFANSGNVPYDGLANIAIVNSKDNSIVKLLNEENTPIHVGIEADQWAPCGSTIRLSEPLNPDYYIMAVYSDNGKDWQLLQGRTPDIASKVSWQGPVADGTITYPISIDCRGKGLRFDTPEKAEYNKPLTITVSPNPGFKMPDQFFVLMSDMSISCYTPGDEIHSDMYCIIDRAAGKITFPTVTGNIHIAAEGIPSSEEADRDASLSALSYYLGEVSYSIQLLPNTFVYDIELPNGTTDGSDIILSVTPNQVYATVGITNAKLSGGKATGKVKVISIDKSTTCDYIINFTIKKQDMLTNGMLNYKITGEKTVSVSGPGVTFDGEYEIIDCIIPETITSADKTYQVTSICDNAFANYTKMKSVTFPAGLKTIGERVFAGCSNTLSEVHCLNPEPIAFPVLFIHSTMEELYNSPLIYKCILYVPEGSVKHYSEANGWKNFGGIFEEGEILEPVVEQVTDNSIVITWNTFEQATGYTLKVFEDAEKTQLKAKYEFDASGELRASMFSFNLNGLSSGQTYYIETTAIRETDYGTPIILLQNTTEIKTTENGTGTNNTDIADTAPIVYGHNGIISISSPFPATVRIYDLTGKCVFDKIINGFEQIRLPGKIYLVKVKSTVYKVAI